MLETHHLVRIWAAGTCSQTMRLHSTADERKEIAQHNMRDDGPGWSEIYPPMLYSRMRRVYSTYFPLTEKTLWALWCRSPLFKLLLLPDYIPVTAFMGGIAASVAKLLARMNLKCDCKQKLSWRNKEVLESQSRRIRYGLPKSCWWRDDTEQSSQSFSVRVLDKVSSSHWWYRRVTECW